MTELEIKRGLDGRFVWFDAQSNSFTEMTVDVSFTPEYISDNNVGIKVSGRFKIPSTGAVIDVRRSHKRTFRLPKDQQQGVKP